MPLLFNSQNIELLAHRVDSIEKAVCASADTIKERIILSDQLREEKVDTIYEFVKQLYDEVRGLRSDVKGLSATHNHIIGAVGLATFVVTAAVGVLGYFVSQK